MLIQHITNDIETGPDSLNEIEAYMPEFEAPANYKDPEAKARSIEEKRKKWIEGSALEAISGVVLCVTVAFGDQEPQVYGADDEYGLIGETLTMFERTYVDNPGVVFVSFCGHSFDYSFLIRRAYKYGIKVPQFLRQRYQFNPTFVDVHEWWQAGNREKHISLDRFAKFCNIPGKVEGVEAKDFHVTWRTNRPLAKSYACGDVIATRALAKHIGAI